MLIEAIAGPDWQAEAEIAERLSTSGPPISDFQQIEDQDHQSQGSSGGDGYEKTNVFHFHACGVYQSAKTCC